MVLSLILGSLCILAGLMYTVTHEYGEVKKYKTEIQTADSEITEESDPQKELEEKFSAMYSIMGDENGIEVISVEYLDDYWEGNYDNEVIYSLNSDEIYYLIQDSVRLYTTYDRIIMWQYEPLTGQSRTLSGWIIERGLLSCKVSVREIHRMILYRLLVLSSPGA